MADYYSAKGEAPGTWMGSGLVGIEGLEAGDIVTTEQMLQLFGHGLDPISGDRLGRPYRLYDNQLVDDFRVEVARRIHALNSDDGRTTRADSGSDIRARARSEVSREFFIREHGREPLNARELDAAVKRYSRSPRAAVAGFDLTFSPVKSVSTLWAVAPRDVAVAIEQAHQAAVSDALSFVEREALFTREGLNGARQVETRGLIATAFTHRDSRAGDPDLHTHIAVANKVQTAAGNWLSVYGHVLYESVVAASETYNTALERHLAEDLGVRFSEKASTEPGKRPIREIVGVDESLNQSWSKRRHDIDVRRRELARGFQEAHGRPPTPAESIGLSQQANLETREAKHEPRSLAEQRSTWRSEAADVLGSEWAIHLMVAAALNPEPINRESIATAWVQATAARIVAELEAHRATWKTNHVRAETQRQVRGANIHSAQADEISGWVIDEVLSRLSINLTPNLDPVSDPDQLRRPDRSSVYRHSGRDIFTSQRILDAEQRITAAAGRTGGRTVSVDAVELGLLESAANGVLLNPGQASLVRDMATSGRRVQVAIAAAGSGKTTAMQVLARSWTDGGGHVIGLAPSATAASTLHIEIGIASDTLAKLVHDLDTNRVSPLTESIGPKTLVIVDEAGMADTPSLDCVIQFALEQGASVRLVGDDQQLSAVGAGGVLRDIATTHGALKLDELMRFSNPAEAAASVALREGDASAFGFYFDQDRIHVGDTTTSTDEVFEAWATDRANGLDSLMLAPTRHLVSELNQRARAARLDGQAPTTEVELSDGNRASVGDVTITRRNNRRLAVSGTDWVKNGDRWTVTGIKNGEVAVRHATSGLHARLPASYVAKHTELGYASTVHTAQGLTADTMHGIITGTESRQMLYTMLTRGRHANHLHLTTAGDGDIHQMLRPGVADPATATEILETILAHDDAAVSAITTARAAKSPAAQLHQAATRYADAVLAGAESALGQKRISELEDAATQVVPGLSDFPAWPALRAHLVLSEAHGRDAQERLAQALAGRALDDADDPAAVVVWRLTNSSQTQSAGPLPWLPSVPSTVAHDPTWGPYATARADRVEELAETVRSHIKAEPVPTWARTITQISPELREDLTIWRAANGVEDSDRRPTGPLVGHNNTAGDYQRRLIRRINDGAHPALAEWGSRIDRFIRIRDDYTTQLAEQLARLQTLDFDAEMLLANAAARGPLPDDHASYALSSRLFDELETHYPSPAPESHPVAPRHQPPAPKPPSPSIGF